MDKKKLAGATRVFWLDPARSALRRCVRPRRMRHVLVASGMAAQRSTLGGADSSASSCTTRAFAQPSTGSVFT
jgi:hypothetical protein